MIESLLFAFIFFGLISIGYLICDIKYSIKHKKFYISAYEVKNKTCDKIIDRIRDAEDRMKKMGHDNCLFGAEDIIYIIKEFKDIQEIEFDQ